MVLLKVFRMPTSSRAYERLTLSEEVRIQMLAQILPLIYLTYHPCSRLLVKYLHTKQLILQLWYVQLMLLVLCKTLILTSRKG